MPSLKTEHQTACIGLGSNLDEPRQQIERALDALDGLPETQVLNHSRLYLSPPLGPPDQPDFVNAVACLATRLDPHALLAALQTIESRHLRQRTRRWGPRTLDLDLLLYGDCLLQTPDLEIPHPRMGERAFVLVPLSDILPSDQRLPDGRTLEEWLLQCPRSPLRPLEPSRSPSPAQP